MSDQTMPVLICTEATLKMLMLISSLLNQERLRRTTALIRDFDHGGEKQVSPRPTTGLKYLRRHICVLLWNDFTKMQSQFSCVRP